MKAIAAFFLGFLAIIMLPALIKGCIKLSNAVDTWSQTQQPIQTAIVSVRGCDIIQYIQDDRLVTAFPAPDQPDTCKLPQKPIDKRTKR